ncbi:sulfiredoxin [Diutina catenulata]
MSFYTSNLRIEEVPLDEIRRPIPPVLDHDKINAMASTLKGTPMASATCGLEDITAGELPPVDVFKVRHKGESYYFAFGGCHRLQAYDRVGPNTLVRCKILPATPKSLRLYLGSSVDSIFT